MFNSVFFLRPLTADFSTKQKFAIELLSKFETEFENILGY
jgi:hypothetical protein